MKTKLSVERLLWLYNTPQFRIPLLDEMLGEKKPDRRFIEKNKILRQYYVLTEDKRFEDAFSVLERKRKELIKELIRLWERFDQVGIRCTVIKLHEDFMEDLDLLIMSESEFSKATIVLENNHYHVIKETRYKTLFSRTCGNIELRIHLHKEISWSNLKFHDNLQIWSRKVETCVNGKKIYIPSPEDRIIITLAHAVFENRYITLNDAYSILNDFALHQVDLDYILSVVQQQNWIKEFCFSINSVFRNFGADFERGNEIRIKCCGMKNALEFPISIPIMIYLRKCCRDFLSKRFSVAIKEFIAYIVRFSVVSFLTFGRGV